MQVFDPFNTPPLSYQTKNNELQSVDNADLNDPDSMYDIWVKPHINEFESFTKNNIINQLKTISKILIHLNKTPPKIHRQQLLKEISIQISLYEALIFRDLFQNKLQSSWTLLKNPSNTTHFIFKNNSTKVDIKIVNNNVNLEIENQPIGKLKIDMENIYLEKVHGTLFNTPFIIDPIWSRQQTKVSAVKILIDHLKTEIVNHKKHKDTLWIGNGKKSIMTISKNKTICMSKKLVLNLKEIHWNDFKIQTMQWYTPWVRLPIQGKFILVRD
ncbi:MAG: hypothetical protein VW397_02390 [Candidatus Margulisiibacteriota bacterium]